MERFLLNPRPQKEKEPAAKKKKGPVSNMKTVLSWKKDWIESETVKGKGIKIVCKACKSYSSAPTRVRGAVNIDPFTKGTFNVTSSSVLRHEKTGHHKASYGKCIICFVLIKKMLVNSGVNSPSKPHNIACSSFCQNFCSENEMDPTILVEGGG